MDDDRRGGGWTYAIPATASCPCGRCPVWSARLRHCPFDEFPDLAVGNGSGDPPDDPVDIHPQKIYEFDVGAWEWLSTVGACHSTGW
ncbi:hypothetical protein CLV40_13836 [Actinokineospora auranticolor]|uniref:Uncharacterized protein n=1 Tax=Actinokineospora auranticolor TaxID=155976 RepID=A0A2S6GBZ7_9PSEU|nr:hypothetical protein CLV40_13836 [Actinokineospora auranticolor]